MSPRRAIVVLGYSSTASSGKLHRICAARIERAGQLSLPSDLVVLSGWARKRNAPSEAALMYAIWKGRAAEIVVDENARSTAQNAVNAVTEIDRAGATHVVVVTSEWHAARAAATFGRLLDRRNVSLEVVPAGRRSRPRTLYELALRPLVPAQLYLAHHGTRDPQREAGRSTL